MRSELFHSLVLSRFPYPIARCYRWVHDEPESREALCALLQQLLEFVGRVFFVDFLSRTERDDILTRDLRRILEKPVTAGMWLDWIERILLYLRSREEDAFLGPAREVLPKSARRKLRRLVELRNRWSHSATRFEPRAFRRDLFRLMEGISGLHNSTLLCPRSADHDGQLYRFQAVSLTGDNPNLARVECRSTVPIATGRVYIHRRAKGEVLSLHPLSIYGACDECGDELFFQFTRLRGRKLVYEALLSNHRTTSADAYGEIEQFFRQRRPFREHPRHFSVPGDFWGVPRTLAADSALGPYRVEALIKIGGMGQIYRARDTRNDESCAIKLLPVELSKDPLLLARFEEEAQNLRKLDHPNVVKLRDLGEDFGDRYLVFDLAPGGTVGGKACTDLSEIGKVLPEEVIVDVALQVCDALSHVHERGILHRDLKPSNLLVSGDRVLVADFGISRARGESALTLTGLPVGTPEYMSPEQVGQEELDARSDLYSLGCILYEFATGRPPYRGETPLTTALYHVQARPPALDALNPGLSTGLTNIIYKLLQKNVEYRYQSARELYSDLRSVHKDPAGPQIIEGDQAPQDAHVEASARERARFRRRLVLTSIVFAVILALALGARPIFRSWRLQALVSRAEEAWKSGVDGWPQACAELEAALAVDPNHADLRALLGRMELEGKLKVEAPGHGDVFFEVRPHGAPELGLDWKPGVLDGSRTIANGSAVAVRIGHYGLTPVVAGQRRGELRMPVCVTQVLYRRESEGWKRVRRLTPKEAEQRREQETEREFVFAEHFSLEGLRLPESVPDGYVWVNRGPFFRSETDFGDGGEAMSGLDGVRVYKSFRLVEDDLQHGFLIAETETTVREFERWFDAFGHTFCQWMVEEARVLDDRRSLRQVKEAVRHVPLELQLRYWAPRLADELPSGGVPDSDALMDIVFARELEESRQKWAEVESRVRSFLQNEERKTRPVGHVNFWMALAFARTQGTIVAGELQPWLASQVEKSRNIEKRLVDLRAQLETATNETFSPSEIDWRLEIGYPRGLHATMPGRIDRAYTNHIYYELYYAGQVPVGSVLNWLETSDRYRGEKRTKGANALKCAPEQWLFEPVDGENIYEPLFQHYGYESFSSRWPRRHFLAWLSLVLDRQQKRTRLLEGILEDLPEQPDEALSASQIPWELRLEFGWVLGWNLPDAREWEKALRGPDHRAFPIAQRPRARDIGNVDSAPVPIEQIHKWDLSPYGVSRMASNVSEWIWPPIESRHDYLKGGNYRMPASHSNAGYLISVGRNVASRWTGFRVIRRLPANP